MASCAERYNVPERISEARRPELFRLTEGTIRGL